MKKIIFWTVILDADCQAWQWTFMFKPTLNDLLTIVEDDITLPCLLTQLVRNVQETSPCINEESGSLTYHTRDGTIFICQNKGFAK